MRTRTASLVLLAAAAAATACEESATSPTAPPADGSGPAASARGTTGGAASASVSQGDAQDAPEPIAGSLSGINDVLAERGAAARIVEAEWVDVGDVRNDDPSAHNRVVVVDDRNLRRGTRWVPGDVRRDGRTDITYMVDRSFAGATGVTPSGPGIVDGEPEIDASFDTWDALPCSAVAARKLPDDGRLPSVIFGGAFPEGVDVGEVGFLPGFVFEQFLGPGASEQILGVTFTFVFGAFDEEGVFRPTDVDGDGFADTRFKEVWYNDAFAWSAIEGADGAEDIQSVALHENGHVYELGHFGKIHATFNQGKGNDNPFQLHVSPRAVMNAIILGEQRELLTTDTGAFCSLFGSWPRS